MKLTPDDYRSYWKVKEHMANSCLPIGGIVLLVASYFSHQWKYAIWGIIFLLVPILLKKR